MYNNLKREGISYLQEVGEGVRETSEAGTGNKRNRVISTYYIGYNYCRQFDINEVWIGIDNNNYVNTLQEVMKKEIEFFPFFLCPMSHFENSGRYFL